MITIRNGNLLAQIDYQKFAMKQNRGLMKGWHEVLPDEDLSSIISPDIPEFSKITVEEIKSMLNDKQIPFKQNCKDKKRLYNILVNS